MGIQFKELALDVHPNKVLVPGYHETYVYQWVTITPVAFISREMSWYPYEAENTWERTSGIMFLASN